MITKPEEHEINRAGKRLLRDVLEPQPFGWVVNDVQEDYGIDSNVQIFDGGSPSGSWFHVQLKSSSSSAYSADRTFISQELSFDHARHFAAGMRQPILVIHADVACGKIYWYAPQLDRSLAAALAKTDTKSITVRIPTCQHLPATAAELLTCLDQIRLVVAVRELTSASARSFAESLTHFPDQATLLHAFQEKNDTLKLKNVATLFSERKYDEARPRAETLLTDPDSTIEIKFWARIQLQAIDYAVTLHTGKPQFELHKVILKHAKELQNLTKSGPKHLKFYSLIAKYAAELEIVVHENFGLSMALRQHLDHSGDPMMVLGIYARRSALTKQIVSKYNRCVRLVQYAASYPDRWVLGRALTTIVNAIAPYLITLRSEKSFEAELAFAGSALQICKLAAWIGNETDDVNAVVMAIISALVTVHTQDSDAYRWADETARGLSDPVVREDALLRIERAVRRWTGEHVDGDYQGDTLWQIIENMSTGLGIDLHDEKSSIVRGLKIAVKDNTPERVLAHCEHLLVSLGATGPAARWIGRFYNITTAGSKVVHCTLHNYHVEGKEQDSAYEQFKRVHCDSCPDRKPRPEDWVYSDKVREQLNARHFEFVRRLAGTPYGFRYTRED